MSMMQITGATKDFGGLKAVDEVSFDVGAGEIVGLIGPNGAGKTTVFNLITGFIVPDSGEILYEGNSLVGLKPHDICKLGITRSFQIVKDFSEMTVLENVMVGAFRLTKNSKRARKEAHDILDSQGLIHLKDRRASLLTISDRKRLEISRALATKPRLLLLDEPMGGMNPTEVNNMMGLIRKIQERGIAVVIIEHVMKAMMSISHRIIVLNSGRKIAEGTPGEVSQNREVLKAYLGEDYLAT
jgi:branched-chain amino acid transport system ATP-binding protein